MNTAETFIQIIEEIKSYLNLLGVVLYADLSQPMKEEVIKIENTIRSIKMINSIARHLLFIYNYNYTGTLKDEIWLRIKKSFGWVV